MGYYVNIISSNAYVPNEHLDDAYTAMCELNSRNDLKKGGRFPQSEDIEDGKPHPDVWFSWLDWNYHETAKTAEEILNAVGFDTYMTADGLLIDNYDSKTGCEEVFLWVIAPFVRSIVPDAEASITWRGEDGAAWRTDFIEGKLYEVELELTAVGTPRLVSI
jgi:hypothetical protein